MDTGKLLSGGDTLMCGRRRHLTFTCRCSPEKPPWAGGVSAWAVANVSSVSQNMSSVSPWSTWMCALWSTADPPPKAKSCSCSVSVSADSKCWADALGRGRNRISKYYLWFFCGSFAAWEREALLGCWMVPRERGFHGFQLLSTRPTVVKGEGRGMERSFMDAVL